MRSAFALLVQHFFGRFFDSEIVSQEGDMRTNMVQALGLVAVPGMFVAFSLLPMGLRFDQPLAHHGALLANCYFFVLYSMVVMGFVMVFEWDALFPDRKDYLILTPLPLPANSIFVGKVLALVGFLALFVVDTNFLGTLLFPLVTGGGSLLLPIYRAHIVAVVAGGVFVALSFAAVQGVLINVLTGRAFRRISPWVQMAAMALVIVVLFLTPLVCANLLPLLRRDSALVRWFPPFWFLGLYLDLLPGHPGGPLFHPLAVRAQQALGIAAAAFAITYLAGYRRHARRVMESVESGFQGPGWIRTRFEWAANRWLLPHPLERATFHFISNTILRNARQRLFLATFAGVSCALALPSIVQIATDPRLPLASFVSTGLLAVPLTLSFFAVTGLRAAFNFPAELRANWLFQICETENCLQHIRAARKWVVLLGVVPVFAMLAPFEFYYRGPVLALVHLSFALVLALILLNLLLVWFRKIPFTCSYFPGKTSMAVMALFYFIGFVLYSWLMGRAEERMIQNPIVLVLFYVLGGAALYGIAWLERREQGIYDAVIYEDQPEPIVRTLELG
jgi:hypothetical protein